MFCIFSEAHITCCAVAQSKVLSTAWVPYGNMETLTPHSFETSGLITMQLCTFDNVGETNTFAKFGWNPPARGRSTHTWNIHFLWLFFLPSSFFLRTCTGQTDEDNFTHNGSKDAVWREKVPSQQVFFSILTFWGSFCPQTPTISPPVGKSQPNKKSRITSKPFKIDKKCQLNMNIKSGSPFQNPRSEITWSAH